MLPPPTFHDTPTPLIYILYFNTLDINWKNLSAYWKKYSEILLENIPDYY